MASTPGDNETHQQRFHSGGDESQGRCQLPPLQTRHRSLSLSSAPRQCKTGVLTHQWILSPKYPISLSSSHPSPEFISRQPVLTGCQPLSQGDKVGQRCPPLSCPLRCPGSGQGSDQHSAHSINLFCILTKTQQSPARAAGKPKGTAANCHIAPARGAGAGPWGHPGEALRAFWEGDMHFCCCCCFTTYNFVSQLVK